MRRRYTVENGAILPPPRITTGTLTYPCKYLNASLDVRPAGPYQVRIHARTKHEDVGLGEQMHIFLRVVAGYTFFTVLFTINLLTHIWQRGGFPLLLKSGFFGIATFIGWAITIFAGVPAAVLLWRLRNSGRIATAIVLGSIGLYYLLGLAFFRKPQSSTGELLFGIVFSGALVWGILSPAAARACRSEISEPRKPDEMGTEFPGR